MVGETIYHKPLELENPGWRNIDEAGLVCMAHPVNNKDINGSEFFITLQPNLNIDDDYPCTVFGRVVKGFEVLDQLENVAVDENDKPIPQDQIFITRCGELEFKPKKKLKKSPSFNNTDEKTLSKSNISIEKRQNQDESNDHNNRRSDENEEQQSKTPIASHLAKPKISNSFFESDKTKNQEKNVNKEPALREKTLSEGNHNRFDDHRRSRGSYEHYGRSYGPSHRYYHENHDRNRKYETNHSNESGVIVKGRGSAKYRYSS